MMIDGGGSASLPVVYSDGNREINVGTVAVDTTLNFKSLLSLLSQRIGISPHQFSVYLAALGTDRKIPVTAKLNLSAVRSDGGAHYFFVKRSKRAKKASANGNGKDAKRRNSPPENVMLLRRLEAAGEPPYMSAYAAPILDRAEYERRLMNLQIERQTYLMNMGVGLNAVGRESQNAAATTASTAVCEECSKARTTGIKSDFHHCNLDAVVVGFRSTAGPISRPARNSGEAGA